MTFPEVTRMMLTSMDFFELRRTAARYSVPYQGVRRQKLIRDLERRIISRSQSNKTALSAAAAARASEGAVSAKPSLTPTRKPLRRTLINTFSTRNTISRV